MAIFTENFAGTGAMSTSWAQAGYLERDTDLGKTTGNTSGANIPYHTTGFGSDQYAQIVVQSSSWADFASGPAVRYAAGYLDSNCYCLSFSTNRLFLQKEAGGGAILADTGTTVTITAGSVIKITAVVSGADTIVKGYIDDVEKLSYTDTSPLTGPYVGIAGYYRSLNIRYDNFEGGDLSVGDTTAPTLTSPTGTATGPTTASGTVSTDEGNGTLYWMASANSTELLATVKGGSSQAVSATGAQSVTVGSLTASTSYYLHYAHTDAAANDSAVVTSAQFTTGAVSAHAPTIISQRGSLSGINFSGIRR